LDKICPVNLIYYIYKNKNKESETMKIWQFLELVKMKGRARAIQGGNKK
jgi:hypothetical protein